MEFAPIALLRYIQPTTDGAASSLPYTISLSAVPSAEWGAHFESFPWGAIQLKADRAPKVVDDGIAIPDVPASERERLLDHIDEAMTKVNEAEARRVEGLPPDMQTAYAEWFDSRSPA
jgi:hypothetical protein